MMQLSQLADPSGAVTGGQALAESQLPEDTDPVGTSEVSDEVRLGSQLILFKALPLLKLPCILVICLHVP